MENAEFEKRLLRVEGEMKNQKKIMNQHIQLARAEFKRMEMLATKEDLKAVGDSVQGVAELIKDFKVGVHVSGKILGFSGKSIIYVGGLFTAIIVIYTSFKWFVASKIGMWFWHLLP